MRLLPPFVHSVRQPVLCQEGDHSMRSDSEVEGRETHPQSGNALSSCGLLLRYALLLRSHRRSRSMGTLPPHPSSSSASWSWRCRRAVRRTSSGTRQQRRPFARLPNLHQSRLLSVFGAKKSVESLFDLVVRPEHGDVDHNRPHHRRS